MVLYKDYGNYFVPIGSPQQTQEAQRFKKGVFCCCFLLSFI